MDPNATLQELRRLAQLLINDDIGDARAAEFAKQFLVLDDWLSHLGSLPDEWFSS